MNLHKYSILQSNPIFTTRDFAIQSKISTSAAARLLSRIASEKEVIRVTRGLWIYAKENEVHPFSITPYLLGNEHGYISLLTALHIHGVLSQIPTRTQVVTTAHSRVVKTKLGVYEFFQMKPEMMLDGVVWSDTKLPFRMATPEKALLDVFYLSTRKGKRFASLPELDLQESGFKKKLFLKLLKNQNFPIPIHRAIQERFEKIK
jgi:predicted transcriptional regulator of viral defense system